MQRPVVLVSGFGPFEEVAENPSGILALDLEHATASASAFEWRSVLLPVSFERAPRELHQFLRAHADSQTSLLLGLGVHTGREMRFELRARGDLIRTSRPDVDGVVAADAVSERVADLRTQLESSVRASVARTEGWRLSEDAGGFVCERTYHELLAYGRERGIPALFVHVPHFEQRSRERQCIELADCVAALLSRER